MKRVRLSMAARADIRLAAAWWNANRPKNPSLFKTELRRAFDLLATQPFVGVAVQGAEKAGIRVVALRASHYLIYYSVAEDVELLRVWQAFQGTRPY
jgi:plasmid stabilization system protein ParE